jgi:RNA polymerase sigma-70 factor (ECF subfamily)
VTADAHDASAENRLCERVRTHVPDGADLDATLDAMCAGDLALALACARGDAAAIGALDETLIPVATAAVRGLRGSDAERDEVLQEVRARLLVDDGTRPPRIADYAGRGDLARWLKATVVRTYLNRVRSVRREVAVDDAVVFERVMAPEIEPELAYLKQQYGASIRAAVADALAALPDTTKVLLRHRFVDELTVDEIAGLRRVHRATVHRWLADARDRLREHVDALLRERLGLEGSDLDSVLRVVASQLDVSLVRVLT